MSAHDGLTVNCHEELTDGGGEPELNEHGNPKLCGTELVFEEHGTYLRTLPSDLRGQYESGALKFTCPGCGGVHYLCPVCSGVGDNTPAGWFRGGSAGGMIPCHNCNQEEITRLRR